QIKVSVAVEIRDGHAHSETVAFWDPSRGYVSESPVAVVSKQIQAGKIAYLNQIERALSIQIRHRSTVTAAETLSSQPGGFGDICKISMAIVLEQVGREAVVCIVIRRGH